MTFSVKRFCSEGEGALFCAVFCAKTGLFAQMKAKMEQQSKRVRKRSIQAVNRGKHTSEITPSRYTKVVNRKGEIHENFPLNGVGETIIWVKNLHEAFGVLLEKLRIIRILPSVFFTFFPIFIMPTLQAKSSSKKPAGRKEPKQKQPKKPKLSGQERWDELLSTPESEAFLTMLVAEVRAERQAGTMLEGDWE
jgi:hypothetical protein